MDKEKFSNERTYGKFVKNKFMEREKELITEEEHFENIKEYWGELMKLVEDDDPSGVEHLLLNRGKFIKDKLPGEDEVWEWLQGRAENKLGRKLMVKLNKDGIIAPIESEEAEESKE